MADSLMYQYMPLPGRRFLRPLTHLYKDELGAVHGKIIVAPLEHAPPYVALSYTWGCPYPESPDEEPSMRIEAAKRNKEIFIEGKRLAITQNLLDYLQLHAGSGMEESETPDFWIDAICINQEDNAEKAKQVSQMHIIYKTASAVLVWLGPEDKFTADAVKFITQIAGVETEDDLRTTLLKVPYPKPSSFANEARHHQNSMFTSFMSILDGMNSMYEDMGGRLYLGYVLPQCRMFECGNPRDKLYGAFGWTVLAKPLGEEPGCQREVKLTNDVLKVDYDEPTPVTYTRVLKHIFEEDRILDPLICSRDPSSTFISQLPSWVPDFSGGTSNVDLAGIRFGAFNATKKSEPIVFKSTEPGWLEVMGQEVDTITMIRVLESPSTRVPDTNLERLSKTIESCLEIEAATRNVHFESVPLGELFDVITNGKIGYRQIEDLPASDGGVFLSKAFDYYTDRGCSSHTKTVTSAALRCRTLLRDLKQELISFLPEDKTQEEMGGDIEEPAARGVTLVELRGRCPNQALFATDKGRVGIGCYDTSESDAVYLLPGLRQPMVLRKTGSSMYKTLGRCYVSGLMEGEAYNEEALAKITLV